jgi:hypothetical protein
LAGVLSFAGHKTTKEHEMKTSETTSTVLKALFDIQERMTVVADAENSHLKSKYATLDGILATIRPILKEAGLMVLQHMDTEGLKITCFTRIVHVESSEWIESEVTLDADKKSAQGVGSALTYTRRYGYCVALGIGMNNDDDGVGAEKAMTRAEEKKAQADELQKFKGAIFPRMSKFDAEALQLAFEESGYISELEDKDEMLRELINQANSKEKLTTIGKRAKTLQDEIEESLK